MKNTTTGSGHYMACCLLMLTYGVADLTYAASARIRTPVTDTTGQLVAKRDKPSKYAPYPHHMAVVTDWYNVLLENENFMKWQDMARCFWQQQTGEQRLMNSSHKYFYKRAPHPLDHLHKKRTDSPSF